MTEGQRDEELQRMAEKLHEMNEKVQGVRIVNSIEGGAAGAAALLVPLAIEYGPFLIQWATKIYQNARQAPETPEQKRSHYAQIATSLEATESLVLSSPQPPAGSGR